MKLSQEINSFAQTPTYITSVLSSELSNSSTIIAISHSNSTTMKSAQLIN